MSTLTYGPTPFHRLKRQQLLTLAIALEAQRDHCIERLDAVQTKLTAEQAKVERVKALQENIRALVETASTVGSIGARWLDEQLTTALRG